MNKKDKIIILMRKFSLVFYIIGMCACILYNIFGGIQELSSSPARNFLEATLIIGIVIATTIHLVVSHLDNDKNE